MFLKQVALSYFAVITWMNEQFYFSFFIIIIYLYIRHSICSFNIYYHFEEVLFFVAAFKRCSFMFASWFFMHLKLYPWAWTISVHWWLCQFVYSATAAAVAGTGFPYSNRYFYNFLYFFIIFSKFLTFFIIYFLAFSLMNISVRSFEKWV